ncbi:MAG: GvpL/GvpF family gas vesicle protein [Desulfomonilaceae bacterium]
MKYLMYCIFSQKDASRINRVPVGVGGGPTYVVEENDLGAVVSAIPYSEISKDSSTILAYNNVVESLHDQFGVIPLRFGTLVGEEAEINRLLEKHGERYKTLLTKLDGCVEIGIRAILNNVALRTDAHNQASVLSPKECASTGAAYLAHRKAHHDAEALATENNQKVIERYRFPFEGLFVGFKGETSKSTPFGDQPGTVFLSLYFLVRRQAVGAFRKVYDQLKSKETTKLMLSGPWPPYNFVLPEDY